MVAKRRSRIAPRLAIGEHDVDLMGLELGEKLPHISGANDQFDVRPADERAQEFELEVARQGGQRPDSQRVTARERAPAQSAHQFVAGLEHRVGVVERDPSGLGESETPPRALEQRMADLRLELLQLDGQRGLRKVQPLGGASEAALMGDRPEIAQVIVVQARHANVPQKRTI